MKSNIVCFMYGLFGILFGGIILGYFLDNLLMGNFNLMERLLTYAPLISAVMPFFVVVLTGVWVNTKLEKVKSRMLLDHSIIEKRAESYASLKEDLNEIYSYIARKGNWKEREPNNIIKYKRKVDQNFKTSLPYWSKSTISAYDNFMEVCFETERGHGLDAGIIAELDKYQNLAHWDDSFNDCFSSGYDEDKLEEAQKLLMEAFSKDFGIN